MPSMTRSILALLATLLPALQVMAATEYKIVTASERGTYIQIGRDLAKLVAPAADIALEVLPSAGSAENVHRLRYRVGGKRPRRASREGRPTPGDSSGRPEPVR